MLRGIAVFFSPLVVMSYLIIFFTQIGIIVMVENGRAL